MQNSKNSPDWRQVVQRLLKAEMSRRGVKYQDLSARLNSIGINQSADNLRNKVNKGILGADLLLQIMYVLNMRKIERDDIIDILELVDFKISKGALGDMFRNEDHPNFKPAGDQILRNFLNGLVIHLRGPKDA